LTCLMTFAKSPTRGRAWLLLCIRDPHSYRGTGRVPETYSKTMTYEEFFVTATGVSLGPFQRPIRNFRGLSFRGQHSHGSGQEGDGRIELA
jgi:hypothetical protein